MVTTDILALIIRRGRIPEMYKVGMVAGWIVYETAIFVFGDPRKNYKPYSDTV